MITDFPKIIGILNVTPDSFSDGGKYFSKELALEHAFELINDGADIIDIGGESTRPGAVPVSIDDEISRVIPIIAEIRKLKPHIKISIDTTKPEVAEEAVKAGATIINNIAGIQNNIDIINIAAKYDTELILMHIQGTPRNMQSNPTYNNVVEDVFNSLESSIDFAKENGANKIIADVGIGFGKTLEHNIELLKNHQEFIKLNVPLCLGISRKAFIGKLLGIEIPGERDVPTAIIHAMLLESGASLIRVHNVKLINQIKIIYNNLFLKK